MMDTQPTREASHSVALVACMRNEGTFVVEWLAYHRGLGFQEILVFTNSCTDGSDLLLDRLNQRGLVTHIRQVPPLGKSPQINAMEIAFQHPKVLGCEWLMHIDADEFFYIEVGKGQISDIIDAVGPADVIAFAWKIFGKNGHGWWDGGNVLTTFTRSQGQPMRRCVDHKSLFKHGKFLFATDHMPKGPKDRNIVVRNTAGDELQTRSLERNNTRSRYKIPFRQVVFTNACLNHYALKTDDIFLMKNDRGDGKGHVGHTRYFHEGQFHRRFDRNEHEDRAILARWPEVETEIAALLADDETRRLNDACLAAYIERRDKVFTPEQIAAWTASPDESEDTTP